MRKIIYLICLLLPILASAEALQIREDAPSRYTVVKGDTLWDISAKFFKDPWKWPEIWALNKQDIKDPHWIYPGNVVYLDRESGSLVIGEPNITISSESSVITATNSDVTDMPSERPSDVLKLEPKMRLVTQHSDAIPAIPYNLISSFLGKPLVVDDVEFSSGPVIVGTYEHRTLLSVNDLAYANKLPEDKGEKWQIYRPNSVFIDPDSGENLGREVIYLGDAFVEKFGNPATLRITKSVMEINKGDHFIQASSGFSSHYLPHSPSTPITAKIISIYGGVQQGGQHAVITLNRGKRDGVEEGHVFGLYQKGEVIKTKGWFTPNVVLPDMRYGLIMVFRVFNKVSYALVMETSLPVQLSDAARNPD